MRSTSGGQKNFVEAGVCDGLTIYYALDAVKQTHTTFNAYLYDSWAGMQAQWLMESERKNVGMYSYLSLEQTKNNLANFKEQVKFVQGYLPDSLSQCAGPDYLTWMHIDLNSAMPTGAVLEHFWGRLECGGIVLLDDYGWDNYRETKNAVDKFITEIGNDGEILHLPTGQAMIFKY